jgi:hypothetical protein
MRQSLRAAIAALHNKSVPGIGSLRGLDMPRERTQSDGSPYEYSMPCFWGDIFYASVCSAIRTVVHHVKDGPEFISVIEAPSSHLMLTIPMNRANPKDDPRNTNGHAKRLREEEDRENKRYMAANMESAADREKNARIAKKNSEHRRRLEQAGKVDKIGPAASAIAFGRSVGPAELVAMNARSTEENAYQDDGGASDPWPRHLFAILNERGLLGGPHRETLNNMLDLRACKTRAHLSHSRAPVNLHAEAVAQREAAEAAAVDAPLVAGHSNRDVETALARGGAPQDHILARYAALGRVDHGDDDDDDDDNDDDNSEEENEDL